MSAQTCPTCGFDHINCIEHKHRFCFDPFHDMVEQPPEPENGQIPPETMQKIQDNITDLFEDKPAPQTPEPEYRCIPQDSRTTSAPQSAPDEPDTLDAIVRDGCTIGFYGPKSEYRQRIEAYVAGQVTAQLEAFAEEILNQYDLMYQKTAADYGADRTTPFTAFHQIIGETLADFTGRRK